MSIARKELTRILSSGWLSLITLFAMTPIALAQQDGVKQGFDSLSVSNPTSSAFTYRGQLKDLNLPASGTYTFRFVLYADQAGDKRLAVAVEDNVVVTNGSFTVRLDFGREQVRTSESWLEVEVQSANKQDSLKALSPRQLLRPTSNAMTAKELVGVPLGISKGVADTDTVVAASTSTSTSQDASPWVKAGRTVRLSTNTDNVGIGMAEPKAKLDVAGTIHASDGVTVGNSVGLLSAGTLNLIEVDSNPLAIGFSNPMSTTPAPGPFSTIRVGIGTTAPTHTLDVNGRARIRVLTPAPALNDIVVANPNGVLFTRPANTLGGGPSWLLAGNALTTGNEFLGTTNNFPLRIFTAGNEWMRILTNGNVGIATTTPNHRLTLGSGNIFLPNANGAFDGNLYFGGMTDSGQTGMRLFGGVVGTIPGGFIDVRVPAANPTEGLRFRVDTNIGGSERMRITAAGNVGIGTAAPTSRLSVGNNTFQVDGSGNLIRINNVTYSWPVTQGFANSVLTNNGSGNLTWAPIPVGGVTGTCSSGANFVTKWASVSGVTCSQIFDNGTNVGIGTTAPNERLEITGNFRLPPSTATVGVIRSGANRFIHNFGGVDNFFAGVNAGNLTMTSTSNTGIGGSVLQSVTSGSGNTAVGTVALRNNTTGAFNTAIGSGTLMQNTTGGSNTAIGLNALSNTTGIRNTAVGVSALVFNTTGGSNTALGFQAGSNLTSGSDNLYISNNGAATESNTTRIGGVQNRTFITGIYNVSTGAGAIPIVIDSNGQLGTVSSSGRFKERIEKMGAASEVLYRLRPVSFLFKPEYGGRPDLPQFGLIAEEVAKVAPQLVAYDKQGKPHTVYYHFLVPMLLNEMQKKDSEIEAMRKRLDALEKVVAGLSKQ